MAFDFCLVKFGNVVVRNVRRDGVVPEIHIEEKCRFGTFVEVSAVCAAVVFLIIDCYCNSSVRDTDGAADIFHARLLLAFKTAVLIKNTLTGREKSRVEFPFFYRVEQAHIYNARFV